MNPIEYEPDTNYITPNIISFQDWQTLKQYGNLTKSFKDFNPEELDQAAVFFTDNMDYLDYIERKEIENITPGYVLLPRFFWETHYETIPKEFIPTLEVDKRINELKRLYKSYWISLENRAMVGNHPLKVEAEPREEQVPVLDFLLDNMQKNHKLRGVLQAPPGAGKAQPVDEPVFTPDGWRKMGDLNPGDFVIGKNGQPTEVLDVYPQGLRDIYKITFNDGTETYSDKEHLWTVWKNRDNYSKTYRTITLGEIIESRPFREEKTKYGTIQKARMWSVPLNEPIVYQKQELPIDPYALGLLIGDGGISTKCISFSDKKRDNFKKLKNILEETYDNFSYSVDKEQYYYLNGMTLRNQLEDLGLFGKKSTEKFIPDIYLKSDISDRKKLLEGLLATDAWKPKDTKRQNQKLNSYEFYTSSPQLAEDFEKLTRELGIYTRKPKINKSPKYTYKGEVRVGKPAYSIIINFAKKRKSIDSIEKIPVKKEAVCIRVKADDHLYITRDYTVTHNTYMSIKTISNFRAKALIIVPNEVLQDQWKEAILQFSDLTEDQIGTIQGSDLSKAEVEIEKPITIIKIQSLFSQIKRNKITDLQSFYRFIDFVIYDECHNSGAATSYAKTSSLFLTPNILGLSATPYRVGLNDYLLKTSIGDTIYKLDHNNLNPSIEIHNIYTEFSPDKVKRLMSMGQDYVMKMGVFHSLMLSQKNYWNYIADIVIYNLSNGYNIVVLLPTIKLMENLKNIIYTKRPDLIEDEIIITLKGKTKQDSLEFVKLERKKLMDEYKKFREELDIDVKNKVIKRKDADIKRKKYREEIDKRVSFLKDHTLDLYHQKNNKARCIISNPNLLSAGYDKAALDNLIVASAPRIGKITTIQSIGRITRKFDGKQEPLVQYFIPSTWLDITKSIPLILQKNIKIQYPDAKFKFIGFQEKS